MRHRHFIPAGLFTICVICVGVGATDVIDEHFDDDLLEPTFARTTNEGWTSEVVAGRLVVSKEEGIGGFSASRLFLCGERLTGDFTIDVHVKKDESVGSIGIATNQAEPGWIGFNDIFFTQVGTIAGIIDASNASQASVQSSATEATFRIQRIGETLSLNYDVGGGFVELLSRTDSILASPMSVSLFHLEQEAQFTQERIGSFDDLLIDADTIVNIGADIVTDGVIDTNDLLAMLADWGPCPAESCCLADINRDGSVDVTDLLDLLAQWST